MKHHCIIHQENSCAKFLRLEIVVKATTTVETTIVKGMTYELLLEILSLEKLNNRSFVP